MLFFPFRTAAAKKENTHSAATAIFKAAATARTGNIQTNNII